MKSRILFFAHRVMLELLRDPLAYTFSLGFPMVMLIIMTLVNRSIPAEAAMTIFRLTSLTPAVWVFGMTFLLLFSAQLLSKDRSEAFLIRLYISPMSSADFLLGYLLPISVLTLLQGTITFSAGAVIGLFTDKTLPLSGILRSMALSLPSILLFLSMGLLLGVLFSEKAAPGISSAVISAAALLGGIWMDIDSMGGVWLKICRVLPFYHSVRLARAGFDRTIDGILPSLLIVTAYAVLTFLLTAFLFHHKRKQ